MQCFFDPKSVAIIGASQWEPAAKYSPEAAKAANRTWVGPTVPDFVNAYKAKYNEEPSYHSAGGYVAGLLIEQAIRQAGATATDKVKAELDKMDIDTFYGNIKFDNTPALHGLQVGHDMVYIQWMKDNGKYVKDVVTNIYFRTHAQPVESRATSAIKLDNLQNVVEHRLKVRRLM